MQSGAFDELERFIQARRRIARGHADPEAALRRAGLTGSRYGEIRKLCRELPSLAEYVNERL